MSAQFISPLVNQLITAIYQGPLEHQPWHGFLELLRQTMQANYATLLLRPPKVGDAGLILNAVVASENIREIYKHSYFELDPFVNLPAGKVVTLAQFMPREALFETEYYQEYMKPVGVFHNMGADMVAADGLNARLRITRPTGCDDFSSQEIELCQLLLPHLQQSIVLHSQLKRTEREREFYADAIDQLAMGTVILDDQAKVLNTNKAARQLLAANDRLRVKAGRLYVGERSEDKAFRQVLEQVLQAHRSSEPGFVKAFRIGASEAANSLGLLLRPLPLVDSSEGKENPSVAIFISDPNQRRQVPAQILADLFGFTPAEAALALLLANGLTLDEASEELEVSRNTAKSHLSSVFSKTGLTRQTKLIQLILKSVAPFAN
ncbi:helix-turn-helix transcriptional regulator [Oceanicoccus sp. KOV_DT_Chl]|uniref:helix-turn-helix transcriptional regulator n=1 Tax=Oceanicoccus sp. KOV_DT_Chl TaxID=1904639 RepID=UPI0011AF3E49|nr:helix-turn-helix transcriptional regulator [Oceanicoccus sp. KOV_DT_Chl]